MTLADQIRAADPEHLAHVGPVWLDSGHRLERESQPDDYSDVRADGPGRFSEWVGNRSPRPYGFTGAAIKLWRDRSHCVWWEPEREGRKVYNDAATIRAVRDLWEFGFQLLTVKLKGPALDSLGGGHVVTLESASIGCVEPCLNDSTLSEYTAELIQELASLISDK